MKLINPDGSPLRRKANNRDPAPTKKGNNSLLTRILSVDRVVAFLVGALSITGFLATPLKDPILYWVYGMDVDLTLRSETSVDPDRGDYIPEVLLSSRTFAGVPEGIIIWDITGVSGEIQINTSKYTTEFEPFHGVRQVASEPLDIEPHQGALNISVHVVAGPSSNQLLAKDFRIEFVRDPKRKFVVSNNFTGTWFVEFPQPMGFGHLEVRHNADGDVNGFLRLNSPLFDGIGPEIAVTGYRDGTAFVLSADIPSVGRLSFKDIVVDHSSNAEMYVLEGEIGIYKPDFTPIAGIKPVPIKLVAKRLDGPVKGSD